MNEKKDRNRTDDIYKPYDAIYDKLIPNMARVLSTLPPETYRSLYDGYFSHDSSKRWDAMHKINTYMCIDAVCHTLISDLATAERNIIAAHPDAIEQIPRDADLIWIVLRGLGSQPTPKKSDIIDNLYIAYGSKRDMLILAIKQVIERLSPADYDTICSGYYSHDSAAYSMAISTINAYLNADITYRSTLAALTKIEADIAALDADATDPLPCLDEIVRDAMRQIKDYKPKMDRLNSLSNEYTTACNAMIDNMARIIAALPRAEREAIHSGWCSQDDDVHNAAMGALSAHINADADYVSACDTRDRIISDISAIDADALASMRTMDEITDTAFYAANKLIPPPTLDERLRSGNPYVREAAMIEAEMQRAASGAQQM